MTIGYSVGSDYGPTVLPPFAFSVREGYNVEAGFFRLFFFNQAVNLDEITQNSPFRNVSPNAVESTVLRNPSLVWGSITLTAIQRRQKAPEDVSNRN